MPARPIIGIGVCFTPHNMSAVHERFEAIYACIAQFDKIMPTTDWRFALRAGLPYGVWWCRHDGGLKPKPSRQAGEIQRNDVPHGKSIRDTVARLFPQRQHRPSVYAIEFELVDFELIALRDILPRQDSDYGVQEVAVVIAVIPAAECNTGKFDRAMHALAETVRRSYSGSASGCAKVDGPSVVAITECIVDGVDRWQLSLESKDALDSCMSKKRSHICKRFYGLVVPIATVQDSSWYWRRFFAESFRAGIRAGWHRPSTEQALLSPVTDVWEWTPAVCLLALKRLSALRASPYI